MWGCHTEPVNREQLNRWGEPEDVDPGDLPVDHWFPSEALLQSEGMGIVSRGLVPLGVFLSVASATGGFFLLARAFSAEAFSPIETIGGAALGASSMLLAVPYGTLVYYAIKKRVLISRRKRGLPISMEPEDIDHYSLPLYRGQRFGRPMLPRLDSGGKEEPLGMKRSYVATIVGFVLFLVGSVVLSLLRS